ncbi:uncharacterized protein LOC117808716 [Xyrichtys novacula]|uniref:Uncharacterized protein LOC117808716 n=1 Tax=Xyrichtys novacula TaxID=13765 RepID=A0AAV1GYB3_XYRNO|nr:uncharacterized protein LOC117808716 [Xyrichtys novacula]
MSQRKDRKEQIPPPQIPKWKGDVQTKPQRDQQQQRSQGPIGQSALQHQAQLDSVFMVLEENIISFVKNELKKFQRALSSDHPECLDSQKEAEDKEQWKSREAFLKITLHFLRGMKKEELADCLQSSKKI